MKGIPYKLHYADVIDNNDLEKKGRVKIKIPYMHKDTHPDLLPWATQFMVGGGGSSDYGKSLIPEEESKIWVGFYDEVDFKKPFYLADIVLSGIHPHTIFEDNVKSKIESDSQYPNTKYTAYKNGVCVGVDSSEDNPEIFMYHPTGTFFRVDNTGNTYLKAGSGDYEKMLKGETVKQFFDDLLTAIVAITVTNPETTSPIPINNIPQFELLRAQLTNLLSLQNHSN